MKNNKTSESRLFKSYLAGLIEGDGSFIIPGNTLRNDKEKLRYAKIKIAFNKNDTPLLEKIQSHFGGYIESKQNHSVLIIQRYENLKYICNFINGYLRTPKINDFHRLIDYLNSKDENCCIEKRGLNWSPIDSDAWFAGITDANGNFNLMITRRKRGSIRVQIQYKLELKRHYSRKRESPQGVDYRYSEYTPVCEEIAMCIDATVYSRPKKRSYGVVVASFNQHSNQKIVEYFDRFPLFSSRYLSYVDWKEIHQLQLEKRHLTPEGLQICKTIKDRFNNNRKVFCWDHLKNFYI